MATIASSCRMWFSITSNNTRLLFNRDAEFIHKRFAEFDPVKAVEAQCLKPIALGW